MAYIIDETYLQRELYVPNSDEINSGAYKEIQEFIDNKSRLCLKEALGYNLFKELDSNISYGTLDDAAPQKWLNLVNGTDYTLNGKTYRWEGLIQNEGAFKKSLLANYVFYYWLLYNQSRMSGVGEVVLKAKNAVSVNSTQRIVSVWNEFINMYQDDTCTVGRREYYYRGIKTVDYLGGNYNNEYSSLIKFLSDNESDYPDAALRVYKKQNQFGI